MPPPDGPKSPAADPPRAPHPPRRLITTPRRLMVNTVLNMANQLVTTLVNFVMVGFFLDQLGEERYGVWILVGSIFSYRNLLSMGLNSAVNRNIPVHLANDDMESVKGVVSTAVAYYLLPASALFVATLVVAANMEAWFAIPEGLGDTSRAVALIVGLSFAATVPLQVYHAVLSSYQRYDLINAISVSSILLRTLLIVVLLGRGNGLLTLSILYAGTEVAIRLMAMAYGRRMMGGLGIAISRVDRSLLRSMMTYGVSTILYMSGAILVFKSADMVIGALISSASVSRFFIATTPVILLTTVIQVFAQAMKPAVSELDARDERARIEEMALLAQKYTLFAILPGVAFMLVMGGAFLDVWVGDRFPDDAARGQLAVVLQILAVGAGLRLSQHTNFIVLVGKGRHRAYGVATAVMIASGVAMEVAAVTVFDAGLEGVALGCAIPMGLISALFLPAYFRSRMGIGFRASLRRSWLPALAATTPGVAVVVGWALWRMPASWPELLLAVAVSAGATAAGAWAFALDGVERARIRRLLPI